MSEALLEANIGTERDPHARYARMRRERPVAKVDHLGASVFTVYRAADAEHVLRDDATFSAAINGRWMRDFLGKTILEMDGEQHRIHRALIAHGFRPRAVSRWEDAIVRPTAHEVIDTFAGRGEADLVSDLAWQFPVRAFARIIGLPDVDFERWQGWALRLERYAVDPGPAKEAAREVRAYFDGVLDDRRREPREDLVTDLVQAEMDGHTLEPDIIHGLLRLLVPAGAGTTYRLLGTLTLALLSEPSRWEAVRADRSLVGPAIEEALRWESPVQFAARETTTDTSVAGVDIPAGTAVTVALGSANRDEERFDDPDVFDVERPEPGRHLAFGGGNHFCLGAHLARLEAAVALNALLDRLPDLRLDPGEHDPHVMGFAFRSPNRVPVRFSPA